MNSLISNLAAAYTKLHAALDKGPIVAEVTVAERKERVTLGRGVVAAAFRSTPQATPFAARLPRVIHAAAQGDYAPLATFVIEVRKASEGAVSAGMMLSVLCAEDAPLFESKNTSDTLMGSYWKDRLKQACAVWKASVLCAARLTASLEFSRTALTITNAASIHRTQSVRFSEDRTPRIGVIRGRCE